MLKSSFEPITDENRKEHPLHFLPKTEKCYAWAKGEHGYYYLSRAGSTWKVSHVHRRTVKNEFTVVWRRYAPDIRPPLSEDRLVYFENALVNSGNAVKRKAAKFPKDYQVKAFYAWEAKFFFMPNLKEYLNISEANDLADRITKELGMKPIKVKYVAQRRNFSYGGESSGSLVKIWDPVRQLVLHEIAHIVHERTMKELTGASSKYAHSHHGKEFVAVYAFIFDRYSDFKYDQILESLEWDEIEIDTNYYQKLCEKYPKRTR